MVSFRWSCNVAVSLSPLLRADANKALEMGAEILQRIFPLKDAV